MIRRIGWVVPGLAVLVLAALVPEGAGAATNWAAGLAAGSRTQSRSGALTVPAAPTTQCATVLGLSNNITINWASVPRATRYTLSRSDGTTFPAQSTLTYTDNGVPVGSYTYTVVASIGSTAWVSGSSPASTPARVITRPLGIFVCN